MAQNEDGFYELDNGFLTATASVGCDSGTSDQIFHNFDGYLKSGTYFVQYCDVIGLTSLKHDEVIRIICNVNRIRLGTPASCSKYDCKLGDHKCSER